ncbi:MAG: FAD-dependent oxidoreductase, partial [Chloroflexota bacterium]
TGIPRYHLPGEVLDGEIARLERLGVEFRLKHPVLKLAQLFRMGYDAVFLGIGLTQGRMLPIPGRELEGVLTGLSFLRSVSLGQAVSLGDRVLVLGGGGVACDVARTALRMGAAQVSLACLESREQMPALPWEVAEAEKEGVTLYPGRTFVRILGENHVTGVECRRLSWMKFDENGKLQMEVIEGSEHALEADTVIFATGQAADLGIVAGNDEIKITGRGTIEVDPGTLATGRRHVFAGGDIVSGQTVINAIAAGRKAAVAIDKDLGGRGIIGPAAVPAREAVAALPPSLPVGERGLMPLAPVAERLNSFMEVELGLAAEMAAAQAQRCLRCDLPITITPANCTGCRICEFRCSLSHGDGFNLSRARIKVRRLVGAENEYDVAITEECDDCGICVRYCPYRALTRSREEQEA